MLFFDNHWNRFNSFFEGHTAKKCQTLDATWWFNHPLNGNSRRFHGFRRISPNREITETGKHPFEKYARQNGNLPQFSGWTKKHETTTQLIMILLSTIVWLNFNQNKTKRAPTIRKLGSMVVNACLYGKEMDFPIPDLCQRQRVGKSWNIMSKQWPTELLIQCMDIHHPFNFVLSNFLLWDSKAPREEKLATLQSGRQQKRQIWRTYLIFTWGCSPLPKQATTWMEHHL